jgi:hypothetical protein
VVAALGRGRGLLGIPYCLFETNEHKLTLRLSLFSLRSPHSPQVCSPTTSTSSPTPPVPKKWTDASITTCSIIPSVRMPVSLQLKTCTLLCVRSLGLALRTLRMWLARRSWRSGFSCGERYVLVRDEEWADCGCHVTFERIASRSKLRVASCHIYFFPFAPFFPYT